MRRWLLRIDGPYRASVAVGILLLAGCAKPAPPPGGPEDRTPPTVVSVNPPANAVRVPLDAVIEIRFSERVEHRSAESSIFVTPYLGTIKFKWRGSRLRLKRSRPLRPNTTYVVTVGSDVRDLRNNTMRQSFTWAFATGDSLNKGRISGRVYADGKGQGILIWAYVLSGRDPDPVRDAADYVTQTDTQGRYELSSLAPVRYRLFAIRDQDRTRTYEPESDALGVPTRDVVLDSLHQSEEHLDFRITVRDTTPPALTSASAPDRNHVELSFSEPLAEEGLEDPGHYVITSSGTLDVRLAYPDPQSSQQIYLVTEAQEEGVTYTVRALGLRDLWDLPLDRRAASVEFTGNGAPDTTRPRVRRLSPADSARAVALNTPVEVMFTEAMDTSATKMAIAVEDTAGQAIPGHPSWPSPQVLRFTPEDGWPSRTVVRVALDLRRCLDLSGNRAADSVAYSMFTTLSRDTLSAISGRVIDMQPGARGAIHLRARQPGRKVEYSAVLADTGRYEFNDILPGVYLLDAFRDSDGNGRYSWGSAIPFQPAERFVVYPDSVLVRARWPNEGNDIRFQPE